MPTKDYYQNDALMIMSNVFSCAQLIFLSYWYKNHGYLKSIFKNDVESPTEEKLLSVQFKDDVPYFEAMVGSWSLACALFFNVCAFAFFMAGSLNDVTAYGSGGFYYGLLDNGNPSRQWYYITGLILVIINVFFFYYTETGARWELRKRAGLYNPVIEKALMTATEALKGITVDPIVAGERIVEKMVDKAAKATSKVLPGSKRVVASSVSTG